MKIFKKLTALLATVAICVTITGCSEETGPGFLTEDGKIPSYTIEEAPDGYYMLSSKDGRAYQGFMAGYVDDMHFWLTEKMDAAIPQISPDDQIVVKNLEERPTGFQFIKMIDYGYTVGTNFIVDTSGTDIKSPTMITFGGDVNPSSPISSYLNSSVTGGQVKILEINGKDFKASMLTPEGYLKGLTKNAMYKFSYYGGTYYESVTVKADSHLFVADTTYSSSSYSEMKSNYFIINLPSSIVKGYYYLPGFGLFYYTGVEEGIGEEIDKVIEDEVEETTEEGIEGLK